MAVYEVVRMPHYREGRLYAVEESFVLSEPIPNEKEWEYLKRLDPGVDSKELTPEEKVAAEVAAKVAAAKAAASK